MNLLLTLLKDAPITRNVLIAYNLDNNRGVQLTDMGYVTDTPGEGKRLTVKQAKEQFKYACMRVNDSLLTGEVPQLPIFTGRVCSYPTQENHNRN